MKEHEIVKIRNSAGVLDIRLIKKLENRECFLGFEKSLEFYGMLRWEFHKQKVGKYMITLCDSSGNDDKMIVAFLAFGKLEIWESEILGDEKEENIYTLME